MNVLVISTPGLGHIHPLVPLVVALRDAGHEVTWAVAPGSCERVEVLGFRCLPAGADREAVTALRREREPDFVGRFLGAAPRERRRVAFPLFVEDAAEQMLADLPAVLDATTADLVVHEPNAYAAAPAATARGIPHVTVGFGGLIPDQLLEDHADLLAALWSAVGLEAPFAGGHYDHLYLHPFPPSLGATPPGRNILPIRPLGFDGAVKAEPPDWLAVLGRDRPLVYVTFGTEIAALAPIAVVVEAIGALDVDAVLTVGPSLDPATVAGAPPNLRVERYVPQRSVLARASALVSHAGSGAVLGAAAAGVPQLCVPVAADQFENADAVSASGAGLTLEPDEVSPSAVARAFTRLLSDATIAGSASRLADEIAAMPHPADHVARLEALADRRAPTG
jgi:UDP:flavonoid glycosyltransferase YjiC (YdhE family)